MNVTDAVNTRKSIRAFLNTPVADELVAELLTKAARAPSGGNLQPWRISVINGATMPRFLSFLADTDIEDKPAYDIYPRDLKSPYRDARFKAGEDMYELLGIPREDKPARFAHLARNYNFFDAPAGLFCFVDRQMGMPQWSDLGMFLQTFMLLAQEAGLDTCAQEAWSMRAVSVSAFVSADPEWMLFCGIALGHRDTNHPVNTLVTDREPLENWATFVE
ncbi:MAG: nitroreductase [Gammaproteobacteria bacterium]|jgi:nitroreductase|nr:nitroreductase [Gammaproteobacteria bacterium]